MSDQLSVALIDEHLKDLVHWERLALHLEDIVYTDIEIIKRENPLVASQRLALFDKWLRKCSKPTWNKLALALEKVDENRLAQQLRKYLQLVKEEKGVTAAVKLQQIPTIVSVDERVTQKLVELQEAFSSIVIELKIGLKQLVESKKTELAVMVMVMNEEKAYGFTGLDDIKDIDSFFRVILSHYHFLNCHLPLILAKRFLNPSEVLEGLYQHQKNVSVLKRDIKIKQLKQVLESFVSKSPHETPVTVKVQDAWDESELHAVEVLLQTMFRLPHSDVLKIFRVVPGSVIIVYLVPHHITESLITHSQHKTEFMRLTGIISLQVGETYVLREDNSEEGDQEEYSFEVALMEAIGLGNHEAVTFLLEHVHADVNTQTQPGSHNHELLKSKFGFLSSYITTLTPLVIAYYSRNTDMMQLLLQHNANPDIPFHDNGVTVLHCASADDDLKTIDMLLMARANPDVLKNDGVTPLSFASQEGRLHVVERLLQAKANPDIPRYDGVTPLYIASQEGHLKIVEVLLQAKAKPDASVTSDGTTPLFIASERGYVEIVELLLEAKANPDISLLGGETPLFLASQKGYLQIVQKLLQAKANPNIPVKDDEVTPLCIASQEGHLHVVEALLQAKANPDISRINGITPLYIASQKGYLHIVKQLLQAKANPDALVDDEATPLFIASQKGYLEIVKWLLQEKANPDISRVDGVTPLFIASQKGYLEIVETLLEAKANPNNPTLSGATPLFIASQIGHVEIVEKLVFGNAITDIPNQEGITPLHIASRNGHLAVVDLLLSANANPEFTSDAGLTPLFIASTCGHLEVVKKLLQWKVSVNTPAYTGSTPLYIACQNGHLEVVKALLQANAVADIPNDNGLTPLFIASQEGHYEIVEELLQAKANPDLSNHLGETPLFIACKNGHVEVIKRLLQANADLNSPSLEGVTPLMIANHLGHTKVSELIEHHIVSSFNDQKNNSMTY